MPPAGVAYEHGPTREALDRYLGRAKFAPVAGFVLAVAGGLVLRATGWDDGRGEETFWTTVGGLISTAGYLVIILGLRNLVQWWITRRRLRANPWMAMPCRYRRLFGGFGESAMLLGVGPEHLVYIRALVWRYNRRLSEETTGVWVAGDPRTRCVVSTSGGELLLWARRPRLGWLRRWRRKQMEPPA